MRPDVQDQVFSIIAREALRDPSELSAEMTLEELGLDSLGLVEVIFAIEETFDVSVPFNANEPAATQFDMSSVGAIVTAVERLITGDSPSSAVA
ncbi:MAG: acyl carrier protein [Thioclava marina]|jgi:Acyl carrier protein|uniref:Phosphopantetheine-binding protein n=1 Tax=Thioclava marina TaxID=1915077 RepID=A0ABX3MMN4_9RHOB|nr:MULTISPECIES: acyl carrier protein [Thioclava]TNE85555.1 MAG: acyl carrier protein [Paracoccaceae bacterium]MBC7144191.1 acyl carrier protein [Thioclava marina]MBD3803732.1 acyl carrier protein [Thioclava sp.]OOY11434.1 phosphopantetheine-binding protein [Thioclava marina]OOY26701.1 phosphopantetheine-binding protein [Thioclava sp. L04-15]